MVFFNCLNLFNKLYKTNKIYNTLLVNIMIVRFGNVILLNCFKGLFYDFILFKFLIIILIIDKRVY